MTIAIILPPREGFSLQAFGAVSLCVRDFTLHSRYREQCTVFGQRDDSPFDGVRYEPLPVRRHWYEPNRRAYVRAILQRMHALNPALIEVHNRPILARMIAAKTTIPVALHLHNNPQEMKAASTPAQRAQLLLSCAAIYDISDWVRNRFLEGLSSTSRALAAQKMRRVPPGIAIGELPTEKSNSILYAGRLTPNKGALEYAQGLVIALPQHPDWQGILIGGRRHSVSTEASPYEQQISEVMQSIGAQAQQPGFLPFDDTQAHFRRAAIAVIPSLWEEPFGRTAIEAMAQGCTVITSGRGGLREVVGDAGICLDDVTPESIANAITYLITHPDERARLQQLGTKRVQDFSIARCTAMLDDARDTILAH